MNALFGSILLKFFALLVLGAQCVEHSDHDLFDLHGYRGTTRHRMKRSLKLPAIDTSRFFREWGSFNYPSEYQPVSISEDTARTAQYVSYKKAAEELSSQLNALSAPSGAAQVVPDRCRSDHAEYPYTIIQFLVDIFNSSSSLGNSNVSADAIYIIADGSRPQLHRKFREIIDLFTLCDYLLKNCMTRTGHTLDEVENAFTQAELMLDQLLFRMYAYDKMLVDGMKVHTHRLAQRILMYIEDTRRNFSRVTTAERFQMFATDVYSALKARNDWQYYAVLVSGAEIAAGLSDWRYGTYNKDHSSIYDGQFYSALHWFPKTPEKAALFERHRSILQEYVDNETISIFNNVNKSRTCRHFKFDTENIRCWEMGGFLNGYKSRPPMPLASCGRGSVGLFYRYWKIANAAFAGDDILNVCTTDSVMLGLDDRRCRPMLHCNILHDITGLCMGMC